MIRAGAQEKKRRNRARTGILVGLDLFLVGGRSFDLVIAARYTGDSCCGKNGEENMNKLD